MDDYKIDYEALYKKLKKDIEDQYDYWKTKEAESHSIERETRVSEYGRLEALIIGLEKNAREEAIDKAYEQN